MTEFDQRVWERYWDLHYGLYKGAFDAAGLERMVELYNTPMSMLQVAKAMYCSQSTVSKYFSDFGIPVRPRNLNIQKAKRNAEEDQIEVIDFLYNGCGLSMSEVARRMGISLHSVVYRLDKYGIPQRSWHDSLMRGLRHRKKRVYSTEEIETLRQRAKEMWRTGTGFSNGPTVVSARARARKESIDEAA